MCNILLALGRIWKSLGKLTKQKGLYFVVNPTQSLGALYFNVKDFGVDFMASNGHKWILSSFGIGAIYIKKKYFRNLENFKPPFFSQSGQKRRENFDNNMKLNISRLQQDLKWALHIFQI